MVGRKRKRQVKDQPLSKGHDADADDRRVLPKADEEDKRSVKEGRMKNVEVIKDGKKKGREVGNRLTAAGSGQSLQTSSEVPKPLKGRLYEYTLGKTGQWRGFGNVLRVGRDVATRLEDMGSTAKIWGMRVAPFEGGKQFRKERSWGNQPAEQHRSNFHE